LDRREWIGNQRLESRVTHGKYELEKIFEALNLMEGN
jgi:hypothetical protein